MKGDVHMAMLKGRQIKKETRGKGAGVLTELRKKKTLYIMLLPAIVFFFIFSYLPMCGVYYAFINYNYVGGLFHSPFVGLTNFKYFFHGGLSSPVWTLTKNTILYNVVFIFLGNCLQCMVAILLTEMSGRFFKRFSQSTILLPYFVSYVVVGTIAYNLFNYEFGVLNGMLKSFGSGPVNFYSTPEVWPVIIVLFYLWKGIGYGTIVYLAAIMGIDREIYEAARIDGCNIFKEICYITLPLLKATFIMLVLFNLGGIMRGQFELFYQLVGRNGQLFRTTDILDTYIYRSLTNNFNVGISTAAGLYQSVFGLVIVLFTNRMVKRADPDSALF